MKKSAIFLCMFFLLLLTLCPGNENNSSKDEILKRSEWNNNYSKYSVDPTIASAIREKIEKIDSIIIYFGFWCSDSRNNVPKFIKLMELVNPDKITINYISVGRKTQNAKYFSDKLKIIRVPTFIFLKNGKEVGRIVENPVKSLSEDILEIIF